MKQSLFGHLVFGFGKSPENLATEALCYILNRSTAANEAFIRLISQTGAKLPPILRFETQIRDVDETVKDEAIPDLAGVDSEGKTVLIGEAKFWAGLTDNQPVTYLQRLSKMSAAILLFIAPSKRFSTLWPELVRRSRSAKLQIGQSSFVLKDFEAVTVGNNSILALVSWRAIINSMLAAVQTDGDADALSDITQLQGLCDRMDETAFLPIQAEELTASIGTRIVQYCDLVDELTDKLVESDGASTKGLNRTHWKGAYVASFVIRKHGYQIQFNAHYWREYSMTPLWLTIKKVGTGRYWSFASEAKKKLVKLDMEFPSRLFQDNNQLLVPLFIPTGVEKSDVILNLLHQIQEVVQLLSDVDE